MPELPEVERVRLTLVPRLAGRRIAAVTLRRRDIWTAAPAFPPRPAAAAIHRQLLAGAVIDRLERRGKQLALIAEDGRVLLVHLGMSGRLTFIAGPPPARDRHVHAWWTVSDGPTTAGELRFRDPRRFGGLWSLPSAAALAERWSKLGPDALEADGPHLARSLQRSRRPVKAALLDQEIIAGVGNIYADEALFGAGIDPRARCDRLRAGDWARLAGQIRAVLRAAIAAGGSTLRDYVDGDGSPGQGRDTHRVYGRAGKPCMTCGKPLQRAVVAQRTTVFCAHCQVRPGGRSRNSRHFSTPPPARVLRPARTSGRASVQLPVSTVRRSANSSSS